MVKTYCALTSAGSTGSTSPAEAGSTSGVSSLVSLSPAATSAAIWEARITDIDSSESPSRNFMPETPEVARPIGRSWASSARKRTACPLRETSRMSSSGPTSSAPISSSSSSRKLMAMTPAWRGEL